MWPVRLSSVVAATVLTVSAAAPLAAEQREAGGSLLIRDITVVDGTGVPARPGLDVVVSEGVIQAIEPTDPERDFEGRTLEGDGGFLIPGLIEGHGHVRGPREDAEALMEWLVQGGVTSLRSMAGDTRFAAGVQQALMTGEMVGPRLYYAALMAGPRFMTDPRVLAGNQGYAPGEAPWAQEITDATDVAQVVAVARGTGAQGIKLYADLSAEQVRRVTAEAHRQGMQVWGHSAIFPAKPVEILEAGVDGVSHAPYLVWEAAERTDDFTLRSTGDFERYPADGPDMDRVIDAMIRHGTVLDATLWVFAGGPARTRPDARVGNARIEWAAAFTRRAHEAGVPVSAGTDGVGRPLAGELPTIHEELVHMVELAGMTPLEALRTATMNAAMAIGVEDSVGSIEVGKAADLVLLEEDPSRDIRATRSIRHVVSEGRVVR